MHQAKVAAFLNQKGGVGKTTSVVNIGAGLSILGKKVLIVDLDPQGHLTTFLGIEPERVEANIYDVLRGRANPREALVEQPLSARMTIDGEDRRLSMTVLPSSLDLAGADMALALAPRREFLLKDALDKLAGDYDYILIDCPPTLGLLATSALIASNQVFVPVQAEYLALESLENLFKAIEGIMDRGNPDLEIGGLIATRFDGRKVINRSVVEALRERFDGLLLKTIVRENIVLAESPSHGKDIFTFRPRSHGAEDYLNLSLEIMDQARRADTHLTVERGGAVTRNARTTIAS